MLSMRFVDCRLVDIRCSPWAVLGNIANNIISALVSTSSVKSLSQDARKRFSSGYGFDGSGEMTVRSHFAVVITVLTGSYRHSYHLWIRTRKISICMRCKRVLRREWTWNCLSQWGYQIKFPLNIIININIEHIFFHTKYTNWHHLHMHSSLKTYLHTTYIHKTSWQAPWNKYTVLIINENPLVQFALTTNCTIIILF